MFKPAPVHASQEFVALQKKLASLGSEIALTKSVIGYRLVRMQALSKDLLKCRNEADSLHERFFADCVIRKLNKLNKAVLDIIHEDGDFVESTPSQPTEVMKKNMKAIYDLEVSFQNTKAKYEDLRETQAFDFAFLSSLEAEYRQSVQSLNVYEKHLSTPSD